MAALLAAVGAVWAPAQTVTVAAPAEDGLVLMQQGKFAEAARLLAGQLEAPTDSTKIPFLVFNFGKALYHSGNFTDAQAAFRRLEREFPQSPYLAHAAFFSGNIQYASGTPDKAVARYLDALSRGSDTRLLHLALQSLDQAYRANPRLKVDINKIAALPEPQRCRTARLLGTRLLNIHQNEDAGKLLALCPEEMRGTTVLPHGPVPLGQELVVAVVVPLSGELATFGEEILNGAMVAAESYRKEAGRPIRIMPFDTKGEPVAAGQLAARLADADVDAVVGPLTSGETAVACAALACKSLPLLAPAATEGGLTLLSESSFQLSPNVELQGVVMAEYAVRNLQADSAVIMTSSQADNLTMARAFERRFRELGGKVVATEYYRTRDKDFGGYIRDIKSILLGRLDDSALYVNDNGDTLEADATPARVDCLFLPGNSDQLRLILPQLNFYNLRGAYLGSDGWGDDALFGLDADITRGGVFPSPFMDKGESEAYLRFAPSYLTRYGKKPPRLACLGHDAVRLIAQAVGKGAQTRDQLVKQLAAISGFEGTAGRLAFGAHRENIEMPLYRIESGQAQPLAVGRNTGSR